MINQVILSGVLTADAEQRQLSKDAELSVLRVAYDRSYRDSNGNWQSIPSYFTVKVFDRRYLSRCKSLAKKGVCVTLAGELKQERWTDETGKNYIVYTDNTTDEEGNKKVYASTFDPKEENPVLGPIETDEEWKVIENILNKLQEGTKSE